MAGEGDAERLVVLLEGRIRDFERNMQRAAGTADRTYGRMQRGSRTATRAMEADMTRSTRVINAALASTTAQVGVLGRTFMTAFAGGIFAGGMAGLVRGARGVVAELSEIAKAADRVGLSTRNFQELEFGMKLAGIETNAFRTGMEQFTDRIGEAAVRGGRLADILKANGVALRDANGQIRPTMDLLRDFANLVKNAASENEAMILTTEAFGDRVGRQMVTALRNGEAAIDDMARATEEAGGVIDDELLRRAEKFDDRWESAWHGFQVNGKSAIMQVITALDDFMAKADEVGNHGIFRWMAERMPTFGGADLTWLDPDLARAHGQPLGPDARIRDAFRTGAGDALSEADQALVEELQKRYGNVAGRAASTIIPGKAESGGRGSRDRAAEAALREAEAVLKLIENLEHELSLVGLSDVEKAKANALRQAGAAATDEQRRQIEGLIEAIHRETEALEANKAAQEARHQAIENLFRMGGDALSSMVDGSMKAEEAIKKLAIQLAFAAAQAALLGTGPLAGLFGGLFGGGGMNLGMGPWGARLPGFAAGTANTGGARGEPRGVVHGQEAVIPLPNGGKVPVQMQGGAAQSIKLDVDVGVSVDENGNLQAYVKNVSRQESQSAVSQGIKGYDKYRQKKSQATTGFV